MLIVLCSFLLARHRSGFLLRNLAPSRQIAELAEQESVPVEMPDSERTKGSASRLRPTLRQNTKKQEAANSLVQENTQKVSLPRNGSQVDASILMAPDIATSEAVPSGVKSMSTRASLKWKYSPFRKTVIPSRVRSRVSSGKDYCSLSNLWLAQEMKFPDEVPVWSLALSCDGTYVSPYICCIITDK